MGRQDQIVDERIKKLEELKKQGFNPYSHKYNKKDTIQECLDAKLKTKVKTAGRVLNQRDIGKITFAQLKDQHGEIQLVLQKDKTPEKTREFFKKYVDSGDFIGISGEIFKTKTGEKSILVDKVEMLTKSILPLPEKYHGLQDEEERYRKRYLDILMNPETMEMFVKKSVFWTTMRQFLLDRGFLEVETPVLETSAGGASATPFKTHHNALDIDVYLRISMGELWQKKLMVAGYEKTFEIGRQFRNEGMDMEHLQDYMQMEFYKAYSDYKDGMKIVEQMYKKVAKAVLGKLKFTSNGHNIDLREEWKEYDFEKTIQKKTGLNIYKASREDIINKLKELDVEYEDNVDKWRLVDTLWKYCRKQISGPGFLTGQPVELAPLAKRKPEDPRKVEQFQVIIGGSELGNGYSELNDPLDQEERFKRQMELKAQGDEEAQEHDKSFVEALKHGMPPTCGFGVSERFFSFLMNKPLRECVLFPLMKPESAMQESPNNEEKNQKTETKKSKESEKKDKKHSSKELPMNREEALKLLKKYNQDEKDFIHYLESEAVMKKIAEQVGEDEEYWGMLGLLHDIDWGITKEEPEKHLGKTREILEKAGFDNDFIKIVLSHGYGHGLDSEEIQNKIRGRDIEYALSAAETITGLIHAYALMRGGKINDMKTKGLKKKFKDKTFAAKVDRDVIKEIENLGISLDEFFNMSIEAIKNIKDRVGLK